MNYYMKDYNQGTVHPIPDSEMSNELSAKAKGFEDLLNVQDKCDVKGSISHISDESNDVS